MWREFYIMDSEGGRVGSTGRRGWFRRRARWGRTTQWKESGSLRGVEWLEIHDSTQGSDVGYDVGRLNLPSLGGAALPPPLTLPFSSPLPRSPLTPLSSHRSVEWSATLGRLFILYWYRIRCNPTSAGFTIPGAQFPEDDEAAFAHSDAEEPR